MSGKPVQTIHYADTNEVLIKAQAKPPTDLSQTLKVIGAGFGRTATVSFTLALEKLLKGRVCHGGSASLVREEAFIKKWVKALDPQTDEKALTSTLKALLAGYVAVTDAPANNFVGELVDIFPDAVVICTVRDPAKWWASFQELLKTVTPKWIPYVFWSMPTLRWFGVWCDGMAVRTKAIYPPGTEVTGPDFLEIHYDYLKRVTPADRLFFFDVKDGWEPLCKILNCPVPDEPFPHANDKEAVKEAFTGLIKAAAVRWLQIFALIGIFVASSYYALK